MACLRIQVAGRMVTGFCNAWYEETLPDEHERGMSSESVFRDKIYHCKPQTGARHMHSFLRGDVSK